MNKILYVKNCLDENKYIMLNDSIAIGPVYKIPLLGELEKDNFEVFFLYLPSGSGIREHYHYNDIEQYRLICGTLKIEGKKLQNNICDINSYHNIDICSSNTIIEVCRVSKIYLNESKKTINNNYFDLFYEKANRNEKLYTLKNS
jgi:hypothetical protein